MENGMKDKTALITGASRGIGRGCAVALGKICGSVAVNYLNREKDAEETCLIIEANGGKAFPIRADVSRAKKVEAMIAEISSRSGDVSILVNNAGLLTSRSLEEITEADWDETLTVNLKSVFLVTQAVLPAMRKAGWGRIINISSIAAYAGGSAGPHYAASKAGVNGMTKAYAKALAGEGITVNDISPGGIETEMLTGDLGVHTSRSPVGRFGRLDEVGVIAAMLAENGYMTGHTISVDGGMHMR
jgi:3-oxoacyl-[acyl-carrier protein] reductase